MRSHLVLGAVGALLVSAAALSAAFTNPSQIWYTAVSGTKRLLSAKLSDTVSVKDFGAVGDGVTDDTAAVVAALATNNDVYFPAGTYLVAPGLTLNQVIRGAGPSNTTIKRTATGDFITAMNANAGIENLTIDGQTASFGSGKGVLVPNAAGHQHIDNAAIINFSLPVLEFAGGGGCDFASSGARYYTTATAGTAAAVKVNGTDADACPRKFINPESDGCTLFDFGGAVNFYASNFYTNGLLFSSTPDKVFITNMRVGTDGGTVAVHGNNHNISGVSAVAFTIDGTGSVLNLQTPNWAITDTGSGNSITQVSISGYAPTWTAASANPSLGNGTLVSRASRIGGWMRYEIDLTIGGTTTLGTGAWQFDLPATAISSTPVSICGSAYMQNGGGTSGYTGAVRVVNNGTFATVFIGSGSKNEHDFVAFNSANIAAGVAFAQTKSSGDSILTTDSNITYSVAGVGAGNYVARLCSDGTTCGAGNVYLTCTKPCADAAGTTTACTLTKGAVAAGTVLTWSLTTACGTTDPAANHTAHFSTPAFSQVDGSAARPFTFDSGATLRFSCEYRVN